MDTQLFICLVVSVAACGLTVFSLTRLDRAASTVAAGCWYTVSLLSMCVWVLSGLALAMGIDTL
jgi:hypothetical protein